MPSVPLDEERPQPVREAVAAAVEKIRAAGKIAGTLMFEHDAGPTPACNSFTCTPIRFFGWDWLGHASWPAPEVTRGDPR